jgi:hypothetical protein
MLHGIMVNRSSDDSGFVGDNNMYHSQVTSIVEEIQERNLYHSLNSPKIIHKACR